MREQKVTLYHVYKERGCVGLEASCHSPRCRLEPSRLVPIPDLKDYGVTLSMRLDEIEARMRCTVCGQRGNMELRPDPNWTPPARGSGV